MKIAMLLVCLISVFALTSARSLKSPGRSLLEESVTLTPDNATFTLQWYGIRNSRPTDQCIVTGYHPTFWTTEQGPLKVFVPQGLTAQIGIEPNNRGNFVQLYSQSENEDLEIQRGARGNDVAGITFRANGGVGSEAFITGAVIRAAGEPEYPATPECAVGLWLSVSSPIEEPPAEPTPEPTPPPPPPPPTVYPKNPCYCTSGKNGGNVCFNFNQATSDINCAPTGDCKEGEAQAGEYTQQAGPVYYCS